MRGLHHFDTEECCDKKTYLAFGSLHVRPRMDYPRFLLTVNTLTVKAALLPYTHLANEPAREIERPRLESWKSRPPSSAVTPKAAIEGDFKTGQRTAART